MGFGESAKKWVAEPLFFVTCTATFLPSISAKLSTNTCPGVGSRYMHVSCSRKVSINESNFSKNRLFQFTLGYPVCAQPTGHGKCSATPTLFPSHSGHPTGLSFEVTFAEGCTVFQLYLRKFSLCHSISNGYNWIATRSRHLARGGTLIKATPIGSPICTGILIQCTFSSYSLRLMLMLIMTTNLYPCKKHVALAFAR